MLRILILFQKVSVVSVDYCTTAIAIFLKLILLQALLLNAFYSGVPKRSCCPKLKKNLQK